MKNALIIVICLYLLSSCRKEFAPDKYPQEWQLTSMFGQIPGSFVSGSDMEWQESF